MKRFKKILVVYDDDVGGDDTLGQGVALARANGARLTIVKALRESQSFAGRIDESEKRLQRVTAGIKHVGVASVAAKVLVGVPFLEIIREVLREDHDLVIASAEGGRVIKDLFFGSTATHLMRKSPCPVWIVKPGQSKPYSQILAAIDPRPDGPSYDPLNATILDLASSLATAHGALLHVMHAWDAEGNDLETLKSELPASTREALLLKHEIRHRDMVFSLLAGQPLSQLRYEVHLPRDLPHRAIVNLVEKRKIDLILMGTVNTVGIPGFFIGSAAEAVLSNVRCGVLTVKPDAFVSPVTLQETITVGERRALH